MSIAEKAMIVRLSVSQWSARKYDRKATKEVADNHNATASEIGRFNKMLIKADALKKISTLVNKVRAYNYANTLPWSNDGDRLLPSANYTEYSAQMREFGQEFEDYVDEFVANYNNLIDDARNRLNGLFNIADYPQNVRHKFNFNVSIAPVPEAGDFRVDVGADSEKIKAEIEERTKSAVKDAVGDLWKRFYDAIQQMEERLNDPKKIFRDSLVDNLLDLTELLPKLNVTNDPELAKLSDAVKQKLVKYDPQTLREDSGARTTTAEEAQKLLDNMSGFLGDVSLGQ